MGTGYVMRTVAITATLAAFSVVTAAQQTQNQAQPTQNQPNQNQGQVQTQPQNQQQAQPQPQQQKKKSFWQKVQDATQAGQNTMQQGKSTVNQATQGAQNGVQQVQNGVQQGVSGVQQGASGAFSGGGNGAGGCGANCFDAGPFQANVSQMMVSQEGAWHVIRMTFQFHNSTNQPLIIAYHDGSMVMVDNNGNAYIPAGGNPGQLQGMGIDRGAQTDAQFVLAPGQTGNALFSVARNRPATSPIGTSYSYNLTIDELQAQNGALAIPVRTYNLNFPTLAPGTSNAAFSATPVNGATTASQTNGVRTTMPQATSTMVNGRPVQTTPPAGTAASVVNNAAMKTPVSTATTPATAKPVAATTTAAPKTTTPVKKTTTTTTTTTK